MRCIANCVSNTSMCPRNEPESLGCSPAGEGKTPSFAASAALQATCPHLLAKVSFCWAFGSCNTLKLHRPLRSCVAPRAACLAWCHCNAMAVTCQAQGAVTRVYRDDNIVAEVPQLVHDYHLARCVAAAQIARSPRARARRAPQVGPAPPPLMSPSQALHHGMRAQPTRIECCRMFPIMRALLVVLTIQYAVQGALGGRQDPT